MERRSRAQATEHRPITVDGAIDPAALYRLDDLKRRMGWRDAGFRAAVRAGLKVFRSGKRLYVLGSDIVAFVTKAKEGDR